MTINFNELTVTKRNGEIKPFDLDKIHAMLFWACDGISNVSVSEIEVKAHLQFYDKIPTKYIHETVVKSAADLISEEHPNYQHVAARLVVMSLRKEVYGQYTPCSILEHVKKCIELGVYDSEILSYYTEEEWDTLEKFIKHDRDELLTYAAIEQFRGKYLVQDRTTGQFFETPQMAYILISAILFKNYPQDKKFKYIKDYYDAISKGPKSTITLATPILAGIRTPVRQFSSCVLIETGDSLESINESSSSMVDYASKRAGIGLNAGRIRAKGSSVKNGAVNHTGNILFYQYFQASLNSCSQGALRKASCTVFYPLWHLEYENLIVMKNNKGTDENRVRHMDYCVQINGYFYQRLINNQDITFFSPHDVPDLYEAFFADQEKFAELYEQYEKDSSIRKKHLPAIDAFTWLLIERNNTGRIYVQHTDHTNTHGAFNPKTSVVRQSNLCLEIILPTFPLVRNSRIPFTRKLYDQTKDMDLNAFRQQYGEIALCTLGSINWGALSSPADFEKAADLCVRGLDELLDYQDYPMIAAGTPALNRRSLGVGVCNLAYFIAKNNLKYSDGSANELVNEYAEAMSYYLIKASMSVAKEKGKCKWFEHTKYADGKFPIDTYKKAVDEIVTSELKMDWDQLKYDVKQHGMRHSTVMALMPVESSSQIINATNGIEPPRSMISVKVSKNGTLKQVVPEIMKLKNKYEYLWDMPHTRGYLEIAAILQKYTDQSISTNTSYNPFNYQDNKVPMSELLKDLVYAYKLGLPTLYYQNTWDGATDDADNNSEEDCESCKL